MGLSIPVPGGFSGAVASGVSTPVAIPAGARRCQVLTSGPAFYIANASAVAINPQNATNSATIGTGDIYEFDLIPGPSTVSGSQTHVHVGGNGGTPTVTVTFTT